MRLSATERSSDGAFGGTRASRGVLCALGVSLALGGCATAGAPAPGAAEAGVRFFNTTDTCMRPLPLTIAVGDAGAILEVPPGGSARLPLAAGSHVATLSASGAPVDTQVWNVGDGEVVEYLGCADPAFLRPGDDRGRVVLRVPAPGCEPGLRGPVDVSLDGRLLARIPPGVDAERWLPTGPASLSAGARTVVAEVRPGDNLVLLGCGEAASVSAGAIWPLVVLGPQRVCAEPGASTWVRAAGLEAAVAPGEAWTVFLPAGRHQVALGAAGEQRRAVVVDIVDGPIVLAPGRCAAASASTGAPAAP